MSTLQSQSKSWWSRSKSKEPPSLRLNRSASSLAEKAAQNAAPKSKDAPSKFNTLVASAMGKKKKLPIQDPPPPSPPTRPPPPPPLVTSLSEPNTSSLPSAHTSRHPKSSPYEGGPLARRYYDTDEFSDPHTISEPRTPSDHPRDRLSYQTSVMTLSEPDPFASGGILSPFIHERNRASVYSDSSYLEVSKRTDAYSNRMSYASSSSNSHSLRSDGQSSRAQLSPPATSAGRTPQRGTPASAAPEPMRHRRQSSTGLDEAQRALLETRSVTRSRSAAQTHGGSASSHSTITPTNYNVKGEVPSMPFVRSNPPSMRNRGMTIGGNVSDRPSTSSGLLNFISGGSHGTSSTPLLRRKASETCLSPRSPAVPSPTTSHASVSASGTRSRSSSIATSPHQPSPSSGRPMVLVRKASSHRMVAPPVAPPSMDLPPPPTPPTFAPATDGNFLDSLDEVSTSLHFLDRRSSSSSSLSFASGALRTGDSVYDLMRDDFGHRDQVYAIDPLSPDPTTSPMKKSSSHQKSLKKAVSQQNIDRRFSGASVADSIGSGSFGHDDLLGSPTSKTPKKQRSFHNTRIGLPPLPSLRHANASSTQLPQSGEQKKEPSRTPQPRKRLFSGSGMRRSTSSHSQPPSSPLMEDDIRSVLSVDSVSEKQKRRKAQPIIMSFSHSGNQMALLTENACISPSWYEEIPPQAATMSRRESKNDYAPEHILSPEAMEELEKELNAEAAKRSIEREDPGDRKPPFTPMLPLVAKDLGLPSPSRKAPPTTKPPLSRKESTASSSSGKTSRSTETFGAGSFFPPSSPTLPSSSSSIVSRPSIRYDDAPGSPQIHTRSSSALSKQTIRPQVPARPSTAQPDSPSAVTPTSPTSSESERPLGLRPPPRPRQDSNPLSYKRVSIAPPIHPLSPPPRRKAGKAVVVADESDRRSQHSSRSSSSRPPSVFDTQKVLQRRSIMKKPSFLEIEDDEEDDVVDDEEEDEDDERQREDEGESESDSEEHQKPPVSPIMESSFLDLDRGKDSFDTIRSDEYASSFVF
ncbi:hypothetical protein K474DRAFT_1671261 [Panus rudis PR-1116 ss-1]|nr:hypothetical protein K474DRAFT_1671261 [Panus rudis PR-1116 ss-1]